MKKKIIHLMMPYVLAFTLVSCNDSDNGSPSKTIHIASPSNSMENKQSADEKVYESPDTENELSYQEFDRPSQAYGPCKDCETPEQSGKNPGQNEECDKNPSQSEGCKYPLAFISCQASVCSGKEDIVEINSISVEFRWKYAGDEERALVQVLSKLEKACHDHPKITSQDKLACYHIKLPADFNYYEDFSIGDSEGSFNCALAME